MLTVVDASGHPLFALGFDFTPRLVPVELLAASRRGAGLLAENRNAARLTRATFQAARVCGIFRPSGAPRGRMQSCPARRPPSKPYRQYRLRE